MGRRIKIEASLSRSAHCRIGTENKSKWDGDRTMAHCTHRPIVPKAGPSGMWMSREGSGKYHHGGRVDSPVRVKETLAGQSLHACVGVCKVWWPASYGLCRD